MANQMTASPGLTRERSFVRTQQPNKRRSLAISAHETDDAIQHLRSKPAIEIYRPPSNVLKMHTF